MQVSMALYICSTIPSQPHFVNCLNSVLGYLTPVNRFKRAGLHH
jgi:hypothetical protein